MRIFDPSYTCMHSFPVVSLSCFLRSLTCYSRLVLAADTIEPDVDPKHTTPLHKLGSMLRRPESLGQLEAHA